MARAKILTIIGTRPEGIKMAPVVRELRRRAGRFEQLVVATGQHREMLASVLAAFDIAPDVNLDLMQPGQDPAEFAARAIAALSRLFADLKPAAVLLQGGTSRRAYARSTATIRSRKRSTAASPGAWPTFISRRRRALATTCCAKGFRRSGFSSRAIRSWTPCSRSAWRDGLRMKN
jgi:UDP-N-acetylglucosamine 2-epimerase